MIRSSIKTFCIHAVIFTLLLPLIGQADYLDELEREAQRSTKVNKSAALPPAKLEKLEQFGELLKFERPATYKFFTKLSLEKKNEVLITYGEDKKLSAASKKIFDLYFEQK